VQKEFRKRFLWYLSPIWEKSHGLSPKEPQIVPIFSTT